MTYPLHYELSEQTLSSTPSVHSATIGRAIGVRGLLHESTDHPSTIYLSLAT